MHLVTDDATASITVSQDQLTLIRSILDLGPDELAAFRRLLSMGCDRWRALADVAESQLQLEQAMASPDAHAPLPRPVGGRLVLPVLCRESKRARDHGTEAPACTWVRDAGGYSCVVPDCGQWTPGDTARGRFISQCFEEADSQDGE